MPLQAAAIFQRVDYQSNSGAIRLKTRKTTKKLGLFENFKSDSYSQ